MTKHTTISKEEYEHLKRLDKETKKIMLDMTFDLNYLKSKKFKKKLKTKVENNIKN